MKLIFPIIGTIIVVVSLINFMADEPLRTVSITNEKCYQNIDEAFYGIGKTDCEFLCMENYNMYLTSVTKEYVSKKNSESDCLKIRCDCINQDKNN